MLAACPVLALYGQNAATLTLDRVYPALAVFVIGTFVVWLALARACRDIHRAGAATSVLLLAGFLAWPILETIVELIVPIRGTLPTAIAFGGMLIGVVAASAAWFMYAKTRRGRISIAVALIAFLVFSVALSPAFGRRAAVAISLYLVTSGVIAGGFLRFTGDRFRLTSTGNVFGGALLVLYVGYALVQERAQATLPDWPPSNLEMPLQFDSRIDPSDKPDIYVIALDGYPRADVLANAFQFDNRGFLASLTAQGFTVVANAETPYAEPVRTLAACFNLAPIAAWMPESLPERSLAHYIQRALDEGRLIPALQAQGYEAIGFDPGIEALRPSSQYDETRRPLTILGEFERILCDRTIAARALQFYFYVRYGNPVYWQFESTRRYINFVFDELPEVAAARSDAPRFAFAYLPTPEPPFLFNADGSRAFPYAIGPLDTAKLFFDPAIHRQAFLDQLAYVNRRVSESVSEVQENASRPCVIVIMSLRGAALRGTAEGPPPRAPIFVAVKGIRQNLASRDTVLLVNWLKDIVETAVMTNSATQPQ